MYISNSCNACIQMLLCILNVAICVFVCWNILDVSRHSKCCNLCICSVSHNGGGAWEGAPPPSHDFFFQNPSIKVNASPLHEAPSTKKWSPPLKSKAPFQEINHRKKTPKEIGNSHYYLCFTYETTLEKDGRNSTEMWFSYLEHSKFYKKSETVC